MPRKPVQEIRIGKLRELIAGGASLTAAIRQMPELTDEDLQKYLDEEAVAAQKKAADFAASRKKPSSKKDPPAESTDAGDSKPDATKAGGSSRPRRSHGSFHRGFGSGGTGLGNATRAALKKRQSANN